MMNRKQKNLLPDLKDYIKNIYISGKVGYVKPDKYFFDYALGDLGVSSLEAIFIGNSIKDDYKGVLNAGIDFVLMDRNNNNQDFKGDKAVNLNEFKQYILS